MKPSRPTLHNRSPSLLLNIGLPLLFAALAIQGCGTPAGAGPTSQLTSPGALSAPEAPPTAPPEQQAAEESDPLRAISQKLLKRPEDLVDVSPRLTAYLMLDALSNIDSVVEGSELQEDKKDEDEDKKLRPILLSEITAESLSQQLTQLGWEIMEGPLRERQGTRSSLIYLVKRGSFGGIIALYDDNNEASIQKINSQAKRLGASFITEGLRTLIAIVPSDSDNTKTAEKIAEIKYKNQQKITVRELRAKGLKLRLENLGWEIIGEPTEQNQPGMRGITYPIVKGNKGGAASIYEYEQESVGKIFEDSMKKQKAAAERDGGKVVTVLFPGDETLGQEVLDQIMGR